MIVVQDMSYPGDLVDYHRDLEVLRIKEFITQAEADRLLAWGLSMEPYLQWNGPGRAFLLIHMLPQQNPLHAVIAEKLRLHIIGRSANVIEPILTNYLSIISDSGAVHPHIDAAPNGTRHLRCNLFLQLPEAGGRPIISGTTFTVFERSLLCFFPSQSLHASEPALGSRKRVLLSFGFLVPTAFMFEP